MAFTAAGRIGAATSRGAERVTSMPGHDEEQVAVGQPTDPDVSLRGDKMAAMKPRTGDGPLEVTKEGRGIVMRVPLEGGGRLVVEMTPDEANALGDALKAIVG
jgi:hypothetical protein